MTRALLVCCACLLLGSCTQRMICPAYQSAFIYDKDELRKKFSYFQQDSTPKIYAASKNKYLIAEPVSYRARVRSLQTVAMRPVPVAVPDSLVNRDSVSMEELSRAARSVIDSTFVTDTPQAEATAARDSVYVITSDREVRVLKYNGADSLDYDPLTEAYVPQVPRYFIKEVRYNMEQDNYMWYMRDAIVLPDVKLAKKQQSASGQGNIKAPAGKKKGKGFFRNLFRKKDRDQSDTTRGKPAENEEFDFIETDTVAQNIDGPQPAGSGRGLAGKRKAGVKGQKAEAKISDKRKEDEDEGF